MNTCTHGEENFAVSVVFMHKPVSSWILEPELPLLKNLKQNIYIFLYVFFRHLMIKDDFSQIYLLIYFLNCILSGQPCLELVASLALEQTGMQVQPVA